MSVFVVPEAPDDEKFRVFVVCFTAFAHQAIIGPSAIAQGGLFGHFFPEILIFSEMCEPWIGQTLLQTAVLPAW